MFIGTKDLKMADIKKTIESIQQQKEIFEGLSQAETQVTFKTLNSLQGHDSFLVDTEIFSTEIKDFFDSL